LPQTQNHLAINQILRVVKLYGTLRYFLCRHCYRLSKAIGAIKHQPRPTFSVQLILLI
jgi:hypothetical protein